MARVKFTDYLRRLERGVNTDNLLGVSDSGIPILVSSNTLINNNYEELENNTDIKEINLQFESKVDWTTNVSGILLNMPNKKLLSVSINNNNQGIIYTIHTGYVRMGISTDLWTSMIYTKKINQFIRDLKIVVNSNTYPYVVIDCKRQAGGASSLIDLKIIYI